MAKVEGSSDAMAQMKEQFQARERENDVRHRDELKSLRDSNRAELDQVKSDASKRVEATQEESNMKLNQKDLQYQKEIENLKAIYAKRATEGKAPSKS